MNRATCHALASRRLLGAMRRRLALARQYLSPDACPYPAEAALAWLVDHGSRGCLPTEGAPHNCPATTAGAMQTLFEFGQSAAAEEACRWLLDVQLSDGSFPDAGGQHASLFHTGQALGGLLIMADHVPDAAECARRAASFLARHVNERGRVVPLEQVGGSFDHWARPAVHLAWLAPLAAAGRRWNNAGWEHRVRAAVDRLSRRGEWFDWDGPLDWFTPSLAALLDLGYVAEARGILRSLQVQQLRDGSVISTNGSHPLSSAALAHLAALWYRLGERRRADRAVACLRRRQRVSGGIVGAGQHEAASQTSREATAATKYFLDACRHQVQVAFEADFQRLPDEIEPNDARLEAVRHWVSELGIAPRVADVGCGKGRFLRRLHAEFPAAELTGIDPACSALARLPKRVTACQGGLLRLPAGDGAFDGAFAVESLEHALLAERAVDELCRVVRPGGRVLVIDKNRALYSLSERAPWERWFAREEVANWLARHCEDVTISPLPTGGHRRGKPLFLCWQATRRRAAAALRAAA